MIHQIESRTFISENLLLHEYEYTFGDKKDVKVNFTYLNVKTCKENEKVGVFTYKQAISLARERRNDKRYKNYEFIITLD